MIPLLHTTLPLPPSTNTLYGQRGSQRYKLASVTQYQQDTMYLLHQAWQNREEITLARSNADIALYVSIHAWMPPKMYLRRDVDNLAKIALDTVLNCYLRIDDSRITDLHIAKRQFAKKPWLYVSVSVIEDIDLVQ